MLVLIVVIGKARVMRQWNLHTLAWNISELLQILGASALTLTFFLRRDDLRSHFAGFAGVLLIVTSTYVRRRAIRVSKGRV